MKDGIFYEQKNISSTVTVMEFMALLAGHIPSPYESLVYYYGVYSSSHRGKEKRENCEYKGVVAEEVMGRGKVSSTLSSNASIGEWASLIHRIFESLS